MRFQIGVIHCLVIPIRIDVLNCSHRIRPSSILRGNARIPIPHLDGCCNDIAGALCAVSRQHQLRGTVIQTQAVIVVRNGVVNFIAAFLVQLHGGAVLRQFLMFAGVSSSLIVNWRPVLFRAFHQVNVGAVLDTQGHNIQCIGTPNNWRSCFSGSAWKYDEKTGQYYLHLFAEGQPDLNWENPEVRDQVFDMMNFWFQKGIDGFRMDVISMISKAGYADGPLCADGLYGDYTDQCTNGPRVHEYLQEMNRRVLSHYDCMTVGENANVNPELACLYAGEDRHELNMVFQFELMDVDGGESRKWEPEHPWKLTDIKKIQTRWQTGLDGKAWNSLYWNNHDQPRVVSRFGCTKDEESRVRSAKMLAVCLYLMQGTPYIYQGEELGMTNKHFDSIDPINDVMTRNAYFEKTQRCGESVADFMKAANYISREHTRTPMHWDDTANAGFTTGTPWIPLNPNYPQINAAKQVGDPDSVYSFYRRLLALRKSDKTFVYGHYALLLPDDEEIYAYTRTLNDEQILVVCNFTDHDVPCPLLNDWQNTELLISNYNTPGNPGSLRPFEAVVYRK